MTPSFSIRPTRSALKPVLSDDPIAGAEGSTADVFYTPSAQWVARHWELIVALFAGSTLLGAWLISSDAPIQPLRNALILLSFVSAGIPALQQVWSKLRKLRIDIDLLMLLGAGLAAVIGSPFEGALLLFLFALSGALETYALQRTKGALVALRKLMPSDATVMEKDGQVRILVRRITIGATVLVRPGEKIPLDGVVIGGASSVDESAITGESIPRDCAVDDQVFAGTLNLNGRLEFRVTKIAADTTVARIVQLVTEARHHPARAQRLIDRIGPTYTIVVITSAIGMALLGLTILDLPMRESLRRGIALLIVGSPCALIIATPVAYLSAMAAAARRGVLVKGGAHLEVVARARVVAFDKTGTLTTGKIQLTNFEMLTGVDDLEGLRLAASVEASSSHPLAEAVNKAARDKGLSPYDISNYEAIAGEGELATVDGKTVWIGRPEAALQQIQDSLNERVAARCREFRKEGKTVSVLVAGDTVGVFAFEDTIRDNAGECVQLLKRQGIQQTTMLTGDHEIVARNVADQLGIDDFDAGLTPAGKLERLNTLREKHGTLVLVGDGINDAPALAHADVGVAMGSIGTDLALEAADIVLLKDRIERVAWLHRHAKRTASIVRQNLTLAIAVIATLSVLAVAGYIPLPIAVIGHEGSTVVVALNALRLLRTKTD